MAYTSIDIVRLSQPVKSGPRWIETPLFWANGNGMQFVKNGPFLVIVQKACLFTALFRAEMSAPSRGSTRSVNQARQKETARRMPYCLSTWYYICLWPIPNMSRNAVSPAGTQTLRNSTEPLKTPEKSSQKEKGKKQSEKDSRLTHNTIE